MKKKKGVETSLGMQGITSLLFFSVLCMFASFRYVSRALHAGLVNLVIFVT